MYGTIEQIKLIADPKGRSRGYAFIVYEREKDMKGQSLFSFHFVTYFPHVYLPLAT
jgi:hypothetical protein